MSRALGRGRARDLTRVPRVKIEEEIAQEELLAILSLALENASIVADIGRSVRWLDPLRRPDPQIRPRLLEVHGLLLEIRSIQGGTPVLERIPNEQLVSQVDELTADLKQRTAERDQARQELRQARTEMTAVVDERDRLAAHCAGLE